MNLRNPFTQPGKWYKANLHTHTTTSDGLQSPAEVAEAYRKAGYHVLVLSDHYKTNDVSGLSRKGFLENRTLTSRFSRIGGRPVAEPIVCTLPR